MAELSGSSDKVVLSVHNMLEFIAAIHTSFKPAERLDMLNCCARDEK